MKLFRISLLIITSTENVVRGFRVLAVLSTKERNTLTPNLLDQLMQLIS